jgi:nucleotide-binding universal stress UspA family protein
LATPLLLVHAYRREGRVSREPVATPEALESMDVSPAEYEGAQLLQRTLHLTGGEAILGPGPAPGLLLQVASARNAALIVVGARRRPTLSQLLSGSVWGTLVASGSTPVVVVPEDLELAPGSGHYELRTLGASDPDARAAG